MSHGATALTSRLPAPENRTRNAKHINNAQTDHDFQQCKLLNVPSGNHLVKSETNVTTSTEQSEAYSASFTIEVSASMSH